MALDNFIPSIWSANIHQALENNLVAVRLANRSYEGEIKNAGDRVKINMFSDPTVAAYTKNSTSITPENLSATQRELIVDRSYYFAFEVDDVDAAQANMGLIAEPLRRAGYSLANTADSYLLDLVADQAGLAQNTSAAPVDLVSTNVEEEILAIGETFNEAGLAFDGRFLIVAPWVVSKMVLAGLTTKTSNDALWSNGFVDRILGFNVFMSQNVTHTATTWATTENIAGIANESFGFAEQILKVEAYRPESAFSDAVKGLHLYGAKVMRPDKTCIWYADKTDEA